MTAQKPTACMLLVALAHSIPGVIAMKMMPGAEPNLLVKSGGAATGMAYQYVLDTIYNAEYSPPIIHMPESEAQTLCTAASLCLGYWRRTTGEFSLLYSGGRTWGQGLPNWSVSWAKRKVAGPAPTPSPTPAPTPSPTPLPPNMALTTQVSGSISMTVGGTLAQVAAIVKPVLLNALGITNPSALSMQVAPASGTRLKKEATGTAMVVTFSYSTTDPAAGSAVSVAAGNIATNPTMLSDNLEAEFVSSGLVFDPSGFSASIPPATVTSTAKATGDPHLVNMFGQRFDLMKPGKHVMLNIPKGANHTNSILLRTEFDTRRIGHACGEIYIKAINITGRWANSVHEGGIHFDAERKGKAKWVSVGSINLKVVWGHTKDGITYLNMAVQHLPLLELPIGGLLGGDDHTVQMTPDPICKRRMSLIQLASDPAWGMGPAA